jgi:RimJ/RimL family protein N-acetyltransferase
MFDWAARTHGVGRFRASIAPDNEPSLALIDRLGFEQVGDQWDEEDGLELIFEGDWPPAARTGPQP